MMSHRIAYLRKLKGMSQSQLASELTISASAVGMYEQGRRIPDLSILIAMADFFDVSLDYLITGEEHEYRHKGVCLEIRYPCDQCFWRNSLESNTKRR